MVIYDRERGIVLVKRRFPPLGWALPGGFVEYGESVETAAVREAKEETGLDVELKGLVGVYSDPRRDLRKHTISTVFWGECAFSQAPSAGDDAAEALFFRLEELPEPLAFDHAEIINDFLAKMFFQ
jgi:8-oxo-dGTP diphosphatase